MVSIKDEFAEEVAVVMTWLVTVLPWSLSYTSDAPLRSAIYFFRFPAFGLQLRFPSDVTLDGRPVDVPALLAREYGGIGLLGNAHLTVPPLQLGAVDGRIALAYALWSAAAIVATLAFALSVAMYLREDAVGDRLPVDYVRLTAITFGVLAVLLGGATALFASSDAAYGFPVPLGVVLIAAFAVLLWRAERVPDAGRSDDGS